MGRKSNLDKFNEKWKGKEINTTMFSRTIYEIPKMLHEHFGETNSECVDLKPFCTETLGCGKLPKNTYTDFHMKFKGDNYEVHFSLKRKGNY